jgi:wyosine [tRNA(Phe)-imidazoG37] synthetase (radical SAM superfamily)
VASILKTTDHSRDIAGLKYVYPVLSRRSGGLSIGINFNTNNACNWRCIYCQVPNLKTGPAPVMDLALLRAELKEILRDVESGDFYERFQVAAPLRMIKDIAISGNGEPTSLPNFAEAVALIGVVGKQSEVLTGSRFVLITNGSLIHQHKVQEGLRKLNRYGGEVWFKLDSATSAGRQLINRAGQSFRRSLDNLVLSAQLCPTKLQTCLIDIDGRGYPKHEQEALLAALEEIKNRSPVRQVMLYTIARPSLQPEGSRLSALPAETLFGVAEEMRSLGFEVAVSL